MVTARGGVALIYFTKVATSSAEFEFARYSEFISFASRLKKYDLTEDYRKFLDEIFLFYYNDKRIEYRDQRNLSYSNSFAPNILLLYQVR